MTDEPNYQVFRECLSSAIVSHSEEKPSKANKRRGAKRSQADSSLRTDPEDLAEFIDFIAAEVFSSLPPPLQSLTYDPSAPTPYHQPPPLPQPLLDTLTANIPLEAIDSLLVYGLTDDPSRFLAPVLNEYAAAVAAAPPVWASTRAHTTACEICDRDWIPLTYHHLIPKQVHAKVLKKGWHEPHMLGSVAWLCRACHSFVHRMASNEVLAREYYTVERILERDEVQQWAKWVGRVRWKAK
ncbi:hypothetical protein ASPZODRAFT_94072 [Penicilliopsis zonata CBS 506.65]|uniref:HNH domain-containing protein n=1 Tax=Penicilliopsis zonata CBS 506.65 TaxID=1073090 RepID=A0A1L9SK39_9EURO|nr:hypothetical protein ASPZODRAFT_94072 [Penicilliopsis zonata CBS 506.65]OJJ47535.1 hypothetical protein ASPZODRAFT_94072 [Penicilliopsis zonata CBS 506.65]